MQRTDQGGSRETGIAALLQGGHQGGSLPITQPVSLPLNMGWLRPQLPSLKHFQIISINALKKLHTHARTCTGNTHTHSTFCVGQLLLSTGSSLKCG